MTVIEEIKKLKPEERIEKLKELEGSMRREIEEAESLIRDSILEIKEASEREHAPIKQVTAVDISQLVTAEEKTVFKMARFEGNSRIVESPSEVLLEDFAVEEAEKQRQQNDPIYGRAIEEAKKEVDYGFRMEEGQKANLNPYQQEASVQSVYSASRTTAGVAGDYWNEKREEELRIRREREVW